MAARYRGRRLLLIPVLVSALALSGCSIAQKVPEGYLTENYLAVPVVAPAESQPADDSGVIDFNRSYAQPEKPKTGKPPKAVVNTAPAAGTAAASSASSGSTSSEKELETVTYNRSESDDKRETLGNVEITSPDVVLENKSIKGDLVVTKDAYGSLSLLSCKVAGDITVNGDIDTLELVDTTVEALYLYSGDDITVNLEGDATIQGTYLKGTNASLNAYNISHDYSGYSVITIEKSTRSATYLDIHGADCKTVICNSECEVTLDNASNRTYVERFIANAPVTIFGAEQIEVLSANAQDILLYGQPDRVTYDEDRYDPPTITS